MILATVDPRARELADYHWCFQQPEILKLYGGQVVVVARQKLWGHGRDHMEAMSGALRALGEAIPPEDRPSEDELVFVSIPEPFRNGDDDPFPS